MSADGSQCCQLCCGIVSDNIEREFADALDGWLLLWGNRGVGKTHLLAAVANALMSRGETPLYVVVPDFLDYLRAGYESDRLNETASRRMRDARLARMVVLAGEDQRIANGKGSRR